MSTRPRYTGNACAWQLQLNCGGDDAIPPQKCWAELSNVAQQSLDQRACSQICTADFNVHKSGVALRFHVPQREGTLVAAVHLLKAHCTVTALECTYALRPASLAALLHLAVGPALTSLKLTGARCDVENTLAKMLAQALSGANRLREVTLAHVWGVNTSARRVLEALGLCRGLTCALSVPPFDLQCDIANDMSHALACGHVSTDLQSRWQLVARRSSSPCLQEPGAHWEPPQQLWLQGTGRPSAWLESSVEPQD